MGKRERERELHESDRDLSCSLRLTDADLVRYLSRRKSDRIINSSRIDSERGVRLQCHADLSGSLSDIAMYLLGRARRDFIMHTNVRVDRLTSL